MPDSSHQPFSGIFVSYRRDDSPVHAGRLSDNLVVRFGRDRIFMDIDAIEPGENFVTVIGNALASCDILIALIGPNWITGRSGTTARLNDSDDYVRMEIAAALTRDIRVVPVLVDKATMPKKGQLPENLAELALRNAVELDDRRWTSDVEKLIGSLDRVLAKRQEARAGAEEEHRRQEADEKPIGDEVAQPVAEEQTRQQAAEARQREANRSALEQERPAEERTTRRLPAEQKGKQEAAEQQRREEERPHREAQKQRPADEATPTTPLRNLSNFWTVNGRVTDEQGIGLRGYLVTVVDRDTFMDDVLGTATTNSAGGYSMSYQATDFRDIIERQAYLYLKVKDTSGKTVYTSKRISFEAGRVEMIDVVVGKT